MQSQLSTALHRLKDTATEKISGALAEDRLQSLIETLSVDLEMVEKQLLAGGSVGASPAPEAALHLLRNGGKRVRPMAFLLAYRCFAEPGPQAYRVASAVELVHAATLLHDDVIDQGEERRGAAASRVIWSNAISVLAGDSLLVQALHMVGTDSKTAFLLPSLLETLRQLVDGEVIQLRGRAQLDWSEARYMEILELKTASLFRFAAEAGGLLSGASSIESKALAEFGAYLGMAFQLVDDALDYNSKETGKSLLADLQEGKLTLPLVLAAKIHPELLEEVARIHAGEAADLASIRDRVIASGACEQARTRAEDYSKRALRALESLPDVAAREMLINVTTQLMLRLS